MFKFYNSVLKESLVGSPFAPEKKEIAPAVAAALIAGGSSILSNVIGGVSSNSAQREANETNLQIARETNKFNYDLHQSDIAQQERMWRLANEHNDPANVVERLKRAGINPATAYGDMNTPASTVGVPGGFPAQSAHVEPVGSLLGSIGSSLFEGVSQGVNAYFQNELLNSEIKSKDVDTGIKRIQLQFEAQKDILDLFDRMADVQQKMQNVKKGTVEYGKLEKEYEMLITQHNLLKDTYQDLRKRESLNNDVLMAQKEDLVSSAALKRSQAAYQDMLRAYYPTITDAQLSVMSAQFTDLVRSAELKVKEGRLTDAKSVSQFLQNGVEAIEFKDKERRFKVHNSNKATRVFYGVLDEIGYNIFHNLKLFGK